VEVAVEELPVLLVLMEALQDLQALLDMLVLQDLKGQQVILANKV
jgi:hypothetical protein